MSNFNFDLNNLQEAYKKAKENAYEKVPAGKYTVKVEKIELGETSTNTKQPGMPMAKVQLRIVDGAHKKQCLFLNRMLVCKDKNNELSALGLHLFNEFLKSLKPSFDIEFKDFDDYKELLLDVAEDIETLTYEVQYSIKNNFPDIKVINVYED